MAILMAAVSLSTPSRTSNSFLYIVNQLDLYFILEFMSNCCYYSFIFQPYSIQKVGIFKRKKGQIFQAHAIILMPFMCSEF